MLSDANDVRKSSLWKSFNVPSANKTEKNAKEKSIKREMVIKYQQWNASSRQPLRRLVNWEWWRRDNGSEID